MVYSNTRPDRRLEQTTPLTVVIQHNTLFRTRADKPTNVRTAQLYPTSMPTEAARPVRMLAS